jgi:hypothetical protein
MAGIDCLRQHLLAGHGDQNAAAIRELFVDALDLDPATLPPPPDESLSSLLRRARIAGFDRAWTPAERALLAAARLERGVGSLAGQ